MYAPVRMEGGIGVSGNISETFLMHKKRLYTQESLLNEVLDNSEINVTLALQNKYNMSKDRKNYSTPQESFLKVVEDTPAYGKQRFEYVAQIMRISASILSDKQKLLLNIIVQLQDTGYCFASNAYFANQLGMANQKGITKPIAELHRKNFIKIHRESRGTSNEKRFIRLTEKTRKLLKLGIPTSGTTPLPTSGEHNTLKGIYTSPLVKVKKSSPTKFDFGQDA